LAAQKSSIVPGVQQRFHKTKGLTGRGVRVAVLDSQKEGKAALPSAPHAKEMTHLIGDPTGGLAPGVTIQQYGFQRDKALNGSYFPKMVNGQMPDSLEALDRYVIEVAAAFPEHVTRQLETIIAEPGDQRAHLVNMSLAESRVTLIQHLVLDLAQTHPDGTLTYPRLNQALFRGKGHLLTADLKATVLLQYLDRLFKEDTRLKGPFHQAIQRYHKACDQLYRAGTLVVVAAGNEALVYPTAQTVSDLDRRNVLTLSPSVLVVGAADNGQTPWDPSDDQVAPFTSPGRVDILTPGAYVWLQHTDGTGTTRAGTSVATATATGLLALTKEAHPRLTNTQLVARLLETADSPRHLPTQWAGSGLMNPDRLIAGTAVAQTSSSSSSPGVTPPQASTIAKTFQSYR
jgi:hypothetical protein